MTNMFDQFVPDDLSEDTPIDVNIFSQFVPEDVAPVTAEPQAAEASPESFGLIDQAIAGGYEMMARFRNEDVVDAAEGVAAHREGDDDFFMSRANRPAFGKAGANLRSIGNFKDQAIRNSDDGGVADLQKLIDERDALSAEADKVPFSPETQKFLDDNSDGTIWEDFAAAPLTIIAELGSRSAANMLPGLSAGVVGGVTAGPVGFAAGMGGGSARVEYAASMMEGLQREGVDLSDAEAIIEAVGDRELMQSIQKRAAIRSAAIGSVDMVAGGLAGKTMGLGFKGELAKELANVTTQAGAQAGLGGAGEAAAQFLSGDDINAREIAAEAAGELVTAPVDVAGAAASGIRNPSSAEAVEAQLQQKAELDNFDQANAAREDAEATARLSVEEAGGDQLDQTLAAQAVVFENELPAVATDPEAVEQEQQQLDDEFAQTPEGRVLFAEEQLLEENAAAAEKREATKRAVQRLGDLGLEPEPGTGIASFIEEEQAAAEEKKVADEEALAAKREAKQAEAQKRIDSELDESGNETDRRDAIGRTESQVDAAIRYEEGVAVKTKEDEQPGRVAAERAAEEFSAGTDDPGPTRNPAIAQALEAAVKEAQTSPENSLPEPTEAQIDAGNYKKGHVKLNGLDISIENPRGSIRSSKPGAPNAWSQEMKHHYGYVRRSEGADGDQVDVFIGTDLDAPSVFVVDQVDQTSGQFDEHKAMYGFKSAAAAKRGYLASYEAGWTAGPITEMPVEDFKKWVRSSDATKPLNANTPVGPISARPTIRASRRAGEANAGNVDVKRTVSNIQKSLPNINATVVNKASELPSQYREAVGDAGNVRGFYDIENDRVVIVAENHNTEAEVERTMMHEGVAHKGLRYVAPTGQLDNILDEVAKTSDLASIASQYQLDLNDGAQAREAAEEYIAQLAEGDIDTGVLGRVIEAVRSALRSVGMVTEWTDNDIKGLLREARRKMQGTPAQQVTLTLQAEIEETGEVVEIQQQADILIRQHDKRVGIIKQLGDCIG